MAEILQSVCDCDELIVASRKRRGEPVWTHFHGRTDHPAAPKTGEDFLDLTGTPHVEGDTITVARRVLADGYGLVNGVILDTFTASAIVQVYDALSPPSQARFAAMPLPKAATVAFRLIERSRRPTSSSSSAILGVAGERPAGGGTG